MTFRLFHVTGLQVIGADRDRNRLALRGIYDRQTIQFDCGHHTLYKVARSKKDEGLPGATALRTLPPGGKRTVMMATNHNFDSSDPFRMEPSIVEGVARPTGILGKLKGPRQRM